MSNLKELTKEQHTNAERQAFVKVLMSGSINPKLYATYLWNQHMKYDLLEAMISITGKLMDVPGIWRKTAIYDDFIELWPYEDQPVTLECTKEYINYLRKIMTDPDALMAHVYVMHLGDMSGGQMIARKVPGAGRMYQFTTQQNTKNQDLLTLTTILGLIVFGIVIVCVERISML